MFSALMVHIFRMLVSKYMKVDLGQNVQLVVSLWRYVFRSFRCGISSFRHTDSEVDSANCQFDLSFYKLDTSFCCRLSFCRFVMAFRHFDVAFHRFDSSSHRGYNSTCITWGITWFVICSLPTENGYIELRLEFALNRVYDRSHESRDWMCRNATCGKENALQRRLTILQGSSQHRFGYATFRTLLCE